jgi:hypothetical protein
MMLQRLRRWREALRRRQSAAFSFAQRAAQFRRVGGVLEARGDEHAQVGVDRDQAAVKGSIEEGVEA